MRAVDTLKDLSMNGLAFCYPDNGRTATEESYKLDILLADCDFYLEDLSFKSVSDFKLDDDFPFSSIKTRQLGLRFKDLKRSQVSKLKYLIHHHTIGEVQGNVKVNSNWFRGQGFPC